MTRQELVDRLSDITDDDPEAGHAEADALLLKYINDSEVKAAFERIRKWYA